MITKSKSLQEIKFDPDFFDADVLIKHEGIHTWADTVIEEMKDKPQLPHKGGTTLSFRRKPSEPTTP